MSVGDRVPEGSIRMLGAGDGTDGAGRESFRTLAGSHESFISQRGEVRGVKAMFQAARSGGGSPRVIIFSQSGPAAGDLGACLSGRFAVERVTSLAAAGNALDHPAGALLIVPSRRDPVGPEFNLLFRRAVDGGCRIFLLGNLDSDFDEDLKDKIMVLPPYPSPALLFEGLSGLLPARKAAED